MNRQHKIIGAYSLLWIFAVMALILNTSDLRPQRTVYVTRMDLGKEIFSEPSEKAVFVTAALQVFIFTTYEDKRISGSVSRIYEYLRKQGVEIEDVGIITHNHFTPRGFTPTNNKTYHYFKDKGFKGLFNIYYPATKKTRTKEDG